MLSFQSMIRALWTALVLLVALGVTASLIRAFRPDIAMSTVVPARERLMASMGVPRDVAERRRPEVEALDRKFTVHRRAVLLHVVPGALYLLLAPLQFVPAIRRRNPAVHRWNGRILLVLALLSIVPGLYFGLLLPFGGWGETIVVALFGGLFITSLVKGFIAIRRKRTAIHREWMLRAFSVGIGISTVRLVSGPLDMWLTRYGVSTPTIFVLSLWIGFGLTTLVGELWIRATRPRVQVALSPANVIA